MAMLTHVLSADACITCAPMLHFLKYRESSRRVASSPLLSHGARLATVSELDFLESASLTLSAHPSTSYALLRSLEPSAKLVLFSTVRCRGIRRSSLLRLE